jgi:hypothetical protein
MIRSLLVVWTSHTLTHTHPQPGALPVERRTIPSTGVGTTTSSLTWDFAHSSPIHTPYYSY